MAWAFEQGWPDHLVATLTKAIADGLSASETARLIGHGVTRNSCIGKARRMGLAFGSGSPLNSAANRTSAVKVVTLPKPKAPPVKAPPKTMLTDQILRPSMPAPAVKRAPHQNAGLAFATRSFEPLDDGPDLHKGPLLATPKRIMDEGFGGCRWPISGSGADMLHCCARRREGQVYCETHRKVSVSAYQPKKRVASEGVPDGRRFNGRQGMRWGRKAGMAE